ncbi:hypothetical protein ACSQ76_00025 [Roseovarius sp. B08]|uniref:hypothetical protein n=1 Tax=Roseovarius sp. B08 TaxID=3449223 RepID=UPI003EDBBBFF
MTGIRNRVERLERQAGSGLVVALLNEETTPGSSDCAFVVVDGRTWQQEPGEADADFVARVQSANRNVVVLEADAINL